VPADAGRVLASGHTPDGIAWRRVRGGPDDYSANDLVVHTAVSNVVYKWSMTEPFWWFTWDLRDLATWMRSLANAKPERLPWGSIEDPVDIYVETVSPIRLRLVLGSWVRPHDRRPVTDLPDVVLAPSVADVRRFADDLTEEAGAFPIRIIEARGVASQMAVRYDV
jgi:hypothetical protein